MAKRHKKGRPVNGILLLDKPQGITSNRALQMAKRIFGAQKAGHTGSLDPLATGLLPICFGESTKISAYLLSASKKYSVRCQLGIKTDSADSDGQVIETRPVVDVTQQKVLQIISEFVGQISQIPPMHSALKKNGVPLYKLAHQGIVVDREPRLVTIYALTLNKLAAQTLDLTVNCSKGTYIRSLVEDIGERLGCGAHVIALDRQQVGPFDNAKNYSIEQLEQLAEQGFGSLDALLLATDSALLDWPQVNLSKDATFFIQQGQAVFVPNVTESGIVRLYRNDGSFLGIGERNADGKITPKRLMDISH